MLQYSTGPSLSQEDIDLVDPWQDFDIDCFESETEAKKLIQKTDIQMLQIQVSPNWLCKLGM